MSLLAILAALAAEAPQSDAQVASGRQAQAVVTIVRPARIQLGEGVAGGDQPASVRETSISDGDGARRPAILIEFS